MCRKRPTQLQKNELGENFDLILGGIIVNDVSGFISHARPGNVADIENIHPWSLYMGICFEPFLEDGRADLYINSIIENISSITGLTLQLSKTGYLQYRQMDFDDDSPVLADNASGSQIARDYVLDALKEVKDNTDLGKRILVKYSDGKTVAEIGGYEIYLDPFQISSFKSYNSLASDTMGYGLTFLHELLHTAFGGKKGYGKQDVISEPMSWKEIGTVEPRINDIREQLGKSYGKRKSYYGVKRNNNGVISRFYPFEEKALDAMTNYHDKSMNGTATEHDYLEMLIELDNNKYKYVRYISTIVEL